MRLRRWITGLVALSAGCETPHSLGVATPVCDGGACLASSVIADGAAVDSEGGAELLRVASALEGTFVGGIIIAAVLLPLEQSLLTLRFEPDASPLTGSYSVECTGERCTELLDGAGFEGHYVLTGLNDLGRVKGYLLVEGGSFQGSREVQSLYIEDGSLVMLLGDLKPPVQLLVVAHRPGSDAGLGTGSSP